MVFSSKKFIFLGILFGALSTNTLNGGPVLLNWILVGVIALFAGSWWGTLLFEQTTTWRWRFVWGLVAFNALHIVIASGLYMIADARPSLLLTSLALAAIPTLFHKKSAVPEDDRILSELDTAHRVLFDEIKEIQRLEQSSVLSSLFVWAPIVIDVYLVQLLHNVATVEAIISPWQVLPNQFFVLFALATFLLLRFTLQKLTLTRLAAMILHFFVFISVAAMIYQVGFGFDGFIHRAAEHTIAQEHVITPKTPYYIGQYMLVTARHHILDVAIPVLDRWLLPLLMSVLVPLALLWFFSTKKLSITLRPLLFALLFPLPLFVATTPQALSLLFVFVAILLANTGGKAQSGARHLALLLSLASAAIHPLSGIPALIYMLYVYSSTLPRVPKIQYGLYTILGVLALPLATFIQTGVTPQFDQLWSVLVHVQNIVLTLHPPDTTLFLQFVYAYKHLFLLVFFVTVIGAELFYFRKKYSTKTNWPLLLTALVLLLNALYFSVVKFPLVIAHEQHSYSLRLLFMSGMFLSPLFFAGLTRLTQTISTDKIMRLTVIGLFLAATTSTLYLSYPRADRIERSKGVSTTIHDLQAVSAIAQDAQEDKATYLVLANQSVSAAAIEQLRFSPSVVLEGQEQFIYPVPTGGPLYPHYLAMVHTHTFIKTARELKAQTGVDRVYLVINHYWRDAKNIVPIAATAAKERFSINEKVWVFMF